MKFNKKLVVATLSTALGLGIVGSITGTVAWYQYSTRATTSIIGSSGGKTGVLQIKMAGAEDSTYTRDLYTATLTSGRSNTVLYPCTFGGIDNNVALPATAKRNPSDGVGNPENWADATSAVDYIQYSVTLRAQQYNASTEQVEPLQDINIYLVYKYYGMSRSKISHICITEDWWLKDPSDGCDVRVATINPSDCIVKWILNDNQIIDRVANALIKLKLVK